MVRRCPEPTFSRLNPPFLLSVIGVVGETRPRGDQAAALGAYAQASPIEASSSANARFLLRDPWLPRCTRLLASAVTPALHDRIVRMSLPLSMSTLSHTDSEQRTISIQGAVRRWRFICELSLSPTFSPSRILLLLQYTRSDVRIKSIANG